MDFIIQSVEVVLKKEFRRSLTDEGVHILDPLHRHGHVHYGSCKAGSSNPRDMGANTKRDPYSELVLLAYYIADVNIEAFSTASRSAKTYLPYSGICLSDCPDSAEGENGIFSKALRGKFQTVLAQKAPLRVIFRNPPYS